MVVQPAEDPEVEQHQLAVGAALQVPGSGAAWSRPKSKRCASVASSRAAQWPGVDADLLQPADVVQGEGGDEAHQEDVAGGLVDRGIRTFGQLSKRSATLRARAPSLRKWS